MKETPREEKQEPGFLYRETLPILEGKRNLNYKILVRINPGGEVIWQEYWKGRFPITRDREGYTLMQLSDLAQIFGPHLHTNLDMELPIDPTFLEVNPRYDFRTGGILEDDDYSNEAE